MRPHWLSGGLWRRVTRISPRGVIHTALNPVYSTRLYRRSLDRTVPSGQFVPPKLDRWPGDAGRGATIMDGDFELAGKTLLETNTPWRANDASSRWRSRASRFDWLCDLQALGGHSARERARQLVLRWIETDGSWNATSWRPEALGGRVANWIGYAGFLLSGAEEDFREGFVASLHRQARHLARVAGNAPPGAGAVLVLKGLILADLALFGGGRREKLALRLDRELATQLLADGGTQERNPSRHLALLRDLIDIRAAYASSGHKPSATLQNAIDKMTPMLRFFRHGDGMLALFNGSIEEEDWLIDVVLERADARGKPLSSAPYSGFERLTVNRALLLLDSGKTPPPGPDLDAHAGALSFEFSVGKERMIVNCGAHMGDSTDWRIAQRTTAAHSTVSVENINSAEIISSGGFGNRPEILSVERQERDGEIWLDAEHDGYRSTFGLIHRRRLHLNGAGTALRGEDTLSGKSGRKFAARFHLHPGVRASLVQDGHAVLLRLPGGEGWRFRAQGGVIALQESVYLGAGDRIKRSQQIVVSAATAEGETAIKWMFARI